MQYRAGTVSATTGSPVVAGTGTAWLAAVEPGAMFAVAGQPVTYTVASVTADDALVLSIPYQGAPVAGANYWITTSFTPRRGYPVAEQGDIDAIAVFTRAIQEIDGDMPETGPGVRVLGDLLDVSDVGGSAGEVLTKTAEGRWIPAPAGAGTVTAANLGTTGARIYSGQSGTALQFRRLRVSGTGASIVENPDDVTISVPPAGEANTGSNAGTPASVGTFAGKTGVDLRFRGIRAGTGVTVTQDVNDIVVAATGGGVGGGEANTASNLGTGTVKPYKQKVGADLQFRSLEFDVARFATTLSADGNLYSVAFRPLALGDLAGVSVGTATAGQFLRRNADGTWGAASASAGGLSSVSADPAPTLGGNLETAGNRVLGLPGTLGGMIERPQAKDYVLSLGLPVPIAVTSIRVRTGSGLASFSLRVNGAVLGADEEGSPGMVGAIDTGGSQVAPQEVATTAAGAELTLRVSSPSADCTDLCFALYYRTA